MLRGFCLEAANPQESASRFWGHAGWKRCEEPNRPISQTQTASISQLASVAQRAGRPAVQFGKGFLLEVLKPSIS